MLRATGWWGAITSRLSMVMADGAELLWRKDCLGCARADVPFVAPGAGVCRECALELRYLPERVIGIEWPPVFAAGPYGGVHRATVLAAKDYHRPDAVQVLGEVFAGVIRHLIAVGTIPDPRLAPLVLLPAPTRPSAARARGGCVVARASAVAVKQLGGQAWTVTTASLVEKSRDSTGLSRVQRAENFASALSCDSIAVAQVRKLLDTPGAMACVVDDVCTTGATMVGFSLALASQGISPRVGVVAARA